MIEFIEENGELNYNALTVDDVEMKHSELNYYSRRQTANFLTSFSESFDANFNSRENFIYSFGVGRGRCWSCSKTLFKRDRGGEYLLTEDNKLIFDAFCYDHIFPASFGGLTTLGNLIMMCPVCNLMKSNKTLQQFLNDSIALGNLSPFYTSYQEALDFIGEYSHPFSENFPKIYSIVREYNLVECRVDGNGLLNELLKVAIEGGGHIFYLPSDGGYESKKLKYGEHYKFIVFLAEEAARGITTPKVTTSASNFFAIAEECFPGLPWEDLTLNKQKIIFSKYLNAYILNLNGYNNSRDAFRIFRSMIDKLLQEFELEFNFIPKVVRKDFNGKYLYSLNEAIDDFGVLEKEFYHHKDSVDYLSSVMEGVRPIAPQPRGWSFGEEAHKGAPSVAINSDVISNDEENDSAVSSNNSIEYGDVEESKNKFKLVPISEMSTNKYIYSNIVHSKSEEEFDELVRGIYCERYLKYVGGEYSAARNETFNSSWKHYRKLIAGKISDDEEKRRWFSKWDNSAKNVYLSGVTNIDAREYLVK